MRTRTMSTRNPARWLLGSRIAVLRTRPALCGLLLLTSSCAYMKMNPPPDVDKSPFPPAAADNSCWAATASNMLAGAGYGDGNTVQARAQDIYGELIAQFGLVSGWADTGLT